MTDSLSRLRAGLDRDEAIARAATELDTAGTGDGTWFAGAADHHGIGLCASERQAVRIDYYPTVDTEHVTRHDPSRVLRQVEAIRQTVIRPYEQAIAELDLTARDVLGDVIAALSSVYPEEQS